MHVGSERFGLFAFQRCGGRHPGSLRFPHCRAVVDTLASLAFVWQKYALPRSPKFILIFSWLHMSGDADSIPVLCGNVSDAMLSELASRGLEDLVGLLHLSKIVTLQKLASMNDRSFEQLIGVLKTASVPYQKIAALGELHQLHRGRLLGRSERPMVEKRLLAVAAKPLRLYAACFMLQSPMFARLRGAYMVLRQYEDSDVDDDELEAAQALAESYERVQAAYDRGLKDDCSEKDLQLFVDVADKVMDALVASCVARSDFRDEASFISMMKRAFNRDNVGQFYLSSSLHGYGRLMRRVSGHRFEPWDALPQTNHPPLGRRPLMSTIPSSLAYTAAFDERPPGIWKPNWLLGVQIKDDSEDPAATPVLEKPVMDTSSRVLTRHLLEMVASGHAECTHLLQRMRVGSSSSSSSCACENVLSKIRDDLCEHLQHLVLLRTQGHFPDRGQLHR